MATSPFVSVRELSHRYPTRAGPVHALDQVSLDVGAGEFVAVVGPSGCGKSTLLLAVAGLLNPSEGTVTIGGSRVERPFTDLGIVFQDPVLLDWRDVLANVMLQADVRGLDRDATRERSRALLARVGLDGFLNRHPYELSGGMRQRVSICRALVHEPPLLLMDEPFGALDALTREQMNLDLQDLWLARRPGVLFVTHAIEEAVFLASRVIVMTPRPGRVAADIAIDLPRPRHPEMREWPSFGHHAREIRGYFEQWGVLRDRTLAEAAA
jgi:NitT/TauT family transport system ATP-binding protein